MASKVSPRRSGSAPPASCGCGVAHEPGTADASEVSGAHVGPVHLSGRRAAGVDPDIKSANLKRLRRIEGQVRGLQRMVDDEKYCADILIQLSSVQEALRAVSRELLRNHLKHCAAAAIRAEGEEAEAMYDELAQLFHRHSR